MILRGDELALGMLIKGVVLPGRTTPKRGRVRWLGGRKIQPRRGRMISVDPDALYKVVFP